MSLCLIATKLNEFSIDGVTVRELNVSWDEVRFVRNRELSRSDWRAVKDRTLPAAWKNYRQFLRDLPSLYDDAKAAAEALNAYDMPEGWSA
jgi:hypothetical protein